MAFNYGTIYNVNVSDPVHSDVYLSWLSSGTTAINITKSHSSGIQRPTVFFIQDDSTNNEATYLSNGIGTANLVVNHVYLGNGTGTSTILTTDTIEVNPMASYTPLGVKKVSSILYYGYGFTTSSSTSTDLAIEINRVSGNSGGGSSSTTIASSHTTIEATAVWSTVVTNIGRCSYISVFYSINTGQGLEGALLCFNLDTESLTTIGSLTLDDSSVDNFYGSNGLVDFHGVAEHMGEAKWWVDYGERTTDTFAPFNARDKRKIYFDGNTTEIWNLYPYNAGLLSDTLNRDAYRYNWVNTKIVRSYSYNGVAYYIVIDSASGVSVANSNASYPDKTPLKITSKNLFPLIGYNGTNYFWLDTNGKSIATMSFTGVTTIRGLFPTLDSITGHIYANALMSDSTSKLIEIDTSSKTISAIYNLPSFPYTGTIVAYANHGNFFISKKETSTFQTAITYITDVPPLEDVGVAQMIVEMN